MEPKSEVKTHDKSMLTPAKEKCKKNEGKYNHKGSDSRNFLVKLHSGNLMSDLVISIMNIVFTFRM